MNGRGIEAASLVICLTVAGLTHPARASEPVEQGARTYIHAGRLLADPATGRVQRDRTVVVAADRIVEIRAGFETGDGDGRVIDLRNSFVLPGLIDSHVHLTFENGPTAELDALKKTAADAAMDAVSRFAAIRWPI